MGYRSDVCGVLAVDGWMDDHNPKRFKELIGKIKLIGEDLLNQLREREVGWKDGVFMFHAEQWKWYDDSPAVAAWDAIWEMANAMEGVSGVFVRIGEEMEDIQVDYMGQDGVSLEEYACVSRRIVFNGRVLGTKTTEEIQA